MPGGSTGAAGPDEGWGSPARGVMGLPGGVLVCQGLGSPSSGSGDPQGFAQRGWDSDGDHGAAECRDAVPTCLATRPSRDTDTKRWDTAASNRAAGAPLGHVLAPAQRVASGRARCQGRARAAVSLPPPRAARR